MRFAIAGEGRTDFIVLKNLLIGFLNDKNLAVTRLLPKDKEPVGWGNVLNYLSTEEFRIGALNTDFVVVQIDTDKCEDWNVGLKNIGDNISEVESFINAVIDMLKTKIGADFYQPNESKILFAITVHDIECWLLPFNIHLSAKQAKIVGCYKALESVATKQGFSLNQKNYEDGKHYETLATEMKKNKILMEKHSLNPSLKIFIEKLLVAFPGSAQKIP